MALAEMTHHSPPRAASTEYYMLDDDGDVLAARPTPLVEVRPLLGVQWHVAAHIEDIVPHVQILDVPVPQLGDRVVDLLREIDAPALVEQVIAVPKISVDRVPQRSVCRRSRRAEQLVEVPTIVSYSSLQQRTAKQTVDIPVPHGRGGFEVPQGFLPSSSGASSSHSPGAVEVFAGVFRTFPQIKKSAGLGPHSGSELGADFNPWTPAAYAGSMVLEEDELGWSRSRSRSRRRTSRLAGLHAVPGAPHGSARTGVCLRRQVHLRTLMG